MKIDRLETHDRYLDFVKKPHSLSIGQCCQNLIDQRPFGNIPFYIFAHARTEDNEPGVKRILWQPRLTKPKAQENSMLFKGYPGTDVVKILWLIPARELWGQYDKGKMIHTEIVQESIHNYLYERAKLEAKEEDDLSDEEIDKIYTEISKEAQKKAKQQI